MQLSDNFSLTELLRSDIADGFLKVANKPGTSPQLKAELSAKYAAQYNPTAGIIGALTELCQHTLQPIAEKCDELYGVESYIKVSSGYRSPAVNAAAKGRPNSQHQKGEAADINLMVDGEERNDYLVKAIQLLQAEGKLKFDQIVLEFGSGPLNPAWVHISYNENGPQRGQVLRKAAGKPYTVYNLFK